MSDGGSLIIYIDNDVDIDTVYDIETNDDIDANNDIDTNFHRLSYPNSRDAIASKNNYKSDFIYDHYFYSFIDIF